MARAAVSRPGRMLAAVAVVLIGLYLGLFLGPGQTPKLGLDLRGGTQVILAAQPLCGQGTVSKDALNQAVDIIRLRVDAAGVGGAAINTQGSDTIVVSAPGASRGQLSGLDQTALLRFRQVLGLAPGTTAPPPSTTASPSTSPSPAPTAQPSTSARPKAHPRTRSTSHDVLPQALTERGAKRTPRPSATPTATAAPATANPTPTPLPVSNAGPCGTSSTASPSASPSAAPASAAPTASASPAPGAARTNTPVPGAASTDVQKVLKVFQQYDCVHGITVGGTTYDNGAQPTEGVDLPADYIVACSDDAQVKYLLAPAAVEGSQIGNASASIDPQTNQWRVNLTFKGSGGDDWYNLTKKAFESNPSTQCGQVDVVRGCNETAIVLDGVVRSAPSSQVDGIAGGSTQITGNFTAEEAKQLADVLKFGALPLKLVKQTETTVSATLGSDQLRGGLIAGIIGLGLVIVYSLLYYRALGLVTVASLALSGLILYAVTTLLGHSALGYTLSLPGIAGFIVAVGITADSFVVFFERLRDEVREGRRLRSAVERAWPRARRTIISADAVSLLAAVVLYIVSIGDVRGFAFTLGLSTISDLFIVFFFTKPLLAVLARTKAFDAGAGWTGVGRARGGARLDAKEA